MKKNAKPAADFEAPNNTGARLTLWVAIVCVVILTIWASMAEIDQVKRAQGQVIASDRTQVIQAVDGGVLRELFVQEGQQVQAGQLLASFEKTRVQAALDDTQGKVMALRITLARLRAEVYGTPLAFSPEMKAYVPLIENQTNLYNRRKTAFTEDIKALRKVHAVLLEENAMIRQLESTGDVSQADILRSRRQIADIEAQITTRHNKFFQDAQAEMTKAQEDLNAQSEALNDRTQLLEQTDMNAPSYGLVKNIRVTTLGGVVRAGDIVMELLPTQSGLVLEAKVYPADIAFVTVGQSANVKLDAFDSSIYGGFKGEVVYVSPDTLIEETQRGPQPYYRVHVKIGEKDFGGDQSQRMEVRPGMTAQVDLVVGERSILSYLVNPVTKVLSQALKPI
ncbi:HlyD family efflux transporter periplasmic adaptor subunit [Limnohabitans sp.]|jgi:adhesin transport system membrane fusion protein|uniref:HlyD family efflux transporter periplasmic adaptor subunit n=1 Tax=Limnohabitans sp. TaxID=1907725 RepID=UPI0037C112E6